MPPSAIQGCASPLSTSRVSQHVDLPPAAAQLLSSEPHIHVSWSPPCQRLECHPADMDHKVEAPSLATSSVGIVHSRSRALSRKARVVLLAFLTILLSFAHYNLVGSPVPTHEQRSHAESQEFDWDTVSGLHLLSPSQLCGWHVRRLKDCYDVQLHAMHARLLRDRLGLPCVDIQYKHHRMILSRISEFHSHCNTFFHRWSQAGNSNGRAAILITNVLGFYSPSTMIRPTVRPRRLPSE